MSKKKKIKVTEITYEHSGVLTQDKIEEAVEAAIRNDRTTEIMAAYDEFENYEKIREYNRQRFINYCHKGTVLEHATSKVKWEVLGLEDAKIKDPEIGFDMFEFPKQFVNMRSLVGGTKTGKKYVKRVPVETFYMYDIVEVPDAVKVLWGDPKDNPPRKPSYSK
jgi:hypothetical protein